MVMASFLEVLGRYASCIDYSVAGCLLRQHDGGCKCTLAVDIETGHCGFCRYRNDGGGLETGRDNSVAQRDAKDIGQEVRQLARIFSQQTSWYLIWPLKLSMG